MFIGYRKIHKIWVIYMFLLFFALFIVIYGTKLLLDSSTHTIDHEKRMREHERRYRNRNVNLIVGHYIGTGNLGNLSKDSLNRNNFSPIAGEGENGKPVVIQSKDILRMQQQFQINRFNLLASDRIPLNRSLPDYRKKKCINKIYPSVLPTTSVIIVFHNEAWSVLLRTVWSVIERSPRKSLAEILLIDDASDREFLKKPLDDYVQQLRVPTRVLRLSKRSGLVAARLLGANHATGDTLTFLDAHCECTTGWLEPLLARVQEDKRKVVCPVIDIISDDNFSYLKSFEFHSGGFNWQLHFRWFTLSSDELQSRTVDITEPFRTPAMAGGLFTIDREYFFEIGSYDEKMKIWGGDNLEMSFRVWQCGGEIEIAPCSHVGHLFRKSSPYTFPGGVNDILQTNLARLALVWMDDWSNFFFKYNRVDEAALTGMNLDISARLKLREQLKCRNFKWYLETIWPQNFFPASNRLFGKFALANERSPLVKKFQKILIEYKNLQKSSSDYDLENWEKLIEFLNKKTRYFHRELARLPTDEIMFCLNKPQTSGVQNQPHGQPTLKVCRNTTVRSLEEMFVTRADGAIMSDENVCLDSPEFVMNVENSTKARLFGCTSTPRQRWKYLVKTQQIKQKNAEYCLEGSPALRHVLQRRVVLLDSDTFDIFVRPCSDSPLQKWIVLPFDWK